MRTRDLANVKECSHMNLVGNKNPQLVPHSNPWGRLDKSMSPRVEDFEPKVIPDVFIPGEDPGGYTLLSILSVLIEMSTLKAIEIEIHFYPVGNPKDRTLG